MDAVPTPKDAYEFNVTALQVMKADEVKQLAQNSLEAIPYIGGEDDGHLFNAAILTAQCGIWSLL